MRSEKPVLKKENGYTIVEAVVNIRQGLVARPSMQLVEECNRYQKKIIIKKLSPPPAPRMKELEVDGKSIMSVMRLAAAKGTKLEIQVEGLDIDASTLAKRLYNGITTPDSIKMDFDEYPKQYRKKITDVTLKEENKMLMYIDKNPNDCHFHEKPAKIAESLSESFDVDYYYDFGPWALEALKDKSRTSQQYQALVTHIPHNLGYSEHEVRNMPRINYRKIYSASLDTLEDIRQEFPALPIIALTELSLLSKAPRSLKERVNKVINKMFFWERDSKEIKKALDNLLK
jgi:phosphotransferase system HPr (HPr) family protein